MQQSTSQTPDERTWAMFCHLSALAGYMIPFGSVIGPLIIWSIKKNEYPSLDQHGKEALNFQITILILKIISIILWIVFIGFMLFGALVIFNIIMIIIASIKANNGERFSYPLSIRFIS
ncbi:MAG: DUF4870 domain-containing protein [Bacteroidales bacterium]|nr:DUF4870 domain-containing protein [Bacteroidales bacterium]